MQDPKNLQKVAIWAPSQHLSDLHYKFTLGPHHVTKYGRHPLRLGEEKKDRKKPQNKNVMVCPIT